MQESRRKLNQGSLGYMWQTFVDLFSLIVGLWVTGYNFLRPLKTVYYPRQTVSPEALLPYRGHIQLVGKPKNPAEPKCVACMMCAKVCPSGCIKVTKAKAAEGDDKAPKLPGTFTLNYNLCSLCGLCVQNCPAKSLEHSNDVYLAGFSRKDFEYDLMQRLKDQAAKKASAPATGGEEKAA